MTRVEHGIFAEFGFKLILLIDTCFVCKSVMSCILHFKFWDSKIWLYIQSQMYSLEYVDELTRYIKM